MKTHFILLLFIAVFTSPLSAQNQPNKQNRGDLKTYIVRFNSLVKTPKDVVVKYSIDGWQAILASPEQLEQLILRHDITQVRREFGFPQALNDSVRSIHYINQVHAGLGGLPSAYTGKGVVIGYVDTGMDYNHGDFKDSNGNTRVIRYWDQQAAFDPSRTPTKYGYGQIFDSSDINSGIQPDYSGSGHGTTVTGTGSGNGLANGLNKGVAPGSVIIAIRTDFNAPNWSMTVAEGIDYVFSVADTLGLGAVVNLSVGDYLGSHDGEDIAAHYIDSLLEQKSGRIVVCAAGNSGAQGKYHVHGTVNADTSFFWLIPNPSSGFGSPAVFVDLWADTSQMKNVNFAFGADSPTLSFRGRTQFHTPMTNIGVPDVYDSIYVNGNRIGKLDYTETIEGANYHLQALVYTDSTTYTYRFMTTGSGSYDAWSGAFLGLSDIQTNLPSVGAFPPIAYYQMPDTLQTLVSSWACSEKVITVANMQNHYSYIDTNGNVYLPSSPVPSGKLSVNSSKGPNRIGEMKPDITAAGDLTLSAFNLDQIAAVYMSNPSMLGRGGLHIRNGGTSMASPIVAGIAALYLEKCPNSTWLDFKNDLHDAAFTDSFVVGSLPNYAWGYGKAHGLNTLLMTNYFPQVMGDTLICGGANPLTTNPPASSIVWNTSSTSYPLMASSSGNYTAEMTNIKGCKAHTDTLHVVMGTMPPASTVSEVDTLLIASNNVNYQWWRNDTLLVGATGQLYVPQVNGVYKVCATDPSGCTACSDTVYYGFLSLSESVKNYFQLYPNPVTNTIRVKGIEKGDMHIFSLEGSEVMYFHLTNQNQYDLSRLNSGVYIIKLSDGTRTEYVKIIKF